MTLLVWLKSLFARFFCIIEFCKACGRRQPLIWNAPDPLWDSVAASSGWSNGAGVLCPTCFDRRARDLGYLLRWRCEVIDA